MTRGQLPQRAGLPGLNGGGAAAAVPPNVHTVGIGISKFGIRKLESWGYQTVKKS